MSKILRKERFGVVQIERRGRMWSARYAQYEIPKVRYFVGVGESTQKAVDDLNAQLDCVVDKIAAREARIAQLACEVVA